MRSSLMETRLSEYIEFSFILSTQRTGSVATRSGVLWTGWLLQFGQYDYCPATRFKNLAVYL